jgi:tetratricopeptide (TPR) repeat protein
VRDGDPVIAATGAAQVAMHLLMDAGLLAPMRVWAKRAERLLEGHPIVAVHAILATAKGYERLLAGDAGSAGELGRRAVQIGTELGVPAAVALGQVMQARSALLADDVANGLDLLDESAAVVMLDDIDPLTVGMAYCELVCAWQGLAQYDRAEELTEAMLRWSRAHPDLGSIHGRCRVHRAEMLRIRGSLADAEDEALAACEELRPYMRREFGWPLTELGTIRLQRGDLEGAEDALVEAYRAGWDPQPGLALLRLAQGDVEAAVATLRDALDHPRNVPSKERPPCTDLQRAPLLAAQVEVALEAGLLDDAQSAADELDRIGRTYQSRPLLAGSALARGRVGMAVGDAEAARRDLKHAVEAFHDLAMPYECARARAALARSYAATGDHHLAAMEADAAAELRRHSGAPEAAPVPRTTSGPRPDPAARGTALLDAEADHWVFEFDGVTLRLRDLKGVRYLARLLAEPGREFHVLDLVTAEAGGPADASAEAQAHDPHREGGFDLGVGPLLDEQAKATYRRRIAEVEDDLAEARDLGDHDRASSAELERDFLVRELARAVGIGGRDRPAGVAAERARVSVTRAIRYALARIGDHHRPLGDHLDHAVRTGTYVAYAPDPASPVVWDVRPVQTTSTSLGSPQDRHP